MKTTSLIVTSLFSFGFGYLVAAVQDAPPVEAATPFVESRTDATLVGKDEDSVLTTLSVGTQGENLEVSVGAGYTSTGDQAAVVGEVRLYEYLGKGYTVEGEVRGVYLTGSDALTLEPQVRLRKYFY